MLRDAVMTKLWFRVDVDLLVGNVVSAVADGDGIRGRAYVPLA